MEAPGQLPSLPSPKSGADTKLSRCNQNDIESKQISTVFLF